MIEILRRGFKGASRTYKTLCPNCGCLFLFQKSDARYDSGGGRESPSYILKCPEDKCKREVWIDASLVK